VRKFLHANGRWRLPSPSIVISMLALFIALSGGAYAVTQIGETSTTVGSEHWGVITRNTIGSGIADLRSGPYGSFGHSGQFSHPPRGNGSLGIQVSDNATTQSPASEKVTFGNEVDFFGQPVSGLTNVGFNVFQSGENAAIGSRNMPNISLEINPHVAGKTYTSMVWVPDAAPRVNAWSGPIDATTTGNWYFSNGTVASATGCDQTLTCSFTDAQNALVAQNDSSGPATIYTVAVSKGRDDEWVGAVDALRINNTIYDFETDGVHEINAP
jgi:hypothetical protein